VNRRAAPEKVAQQVGQIGQTTRAKGTSRRVHRGGSLNSFPDNCRSADRSAIEPASRNLYLGLRLARVPVGKAGK
jgi:formylglycine-generating enzyme required for sulfatase activity